VANWRTGTQAQKLASRSSLLEGGAVNAEIDLRGVDVTRMAEADGVRLRGNPRGTLVGKCPSQACRADPKNDDRFGIITNARAGIQLWRCRKCHPKEADAIEYLRHMRGMAASTKSEWRAIFEALREYGYGGASGSPSALPKADRARPLATREGVPIPAQLESPPDSAWQAEARAHLEACVARLWHPAQAHVLDYLRTKRMLADETIRSFRLGFCNRTNARAGEWRGITIPLEYGGSLWSVNVRTNGKDGMPKYMQRTGSRRCVAFNGDSLADESVKRVVICEGEFDCMLIHQHAPSGTAAITFGGKDAAPNYEALLLLRGKRCFCAFDADTAGDLGAAAWQSIARRVRVPYGKDITEYAASGGDLAKWIAALDELDSSGCCDDLWHDEVMRAVARAGMVAVWRNER
jgi:hypothetical protein